MNSFISIRSAIEALEKEKPSQFVNKDGSIDLFSAGQLKQWYRDGISIMRLPVEVVRCKDCKHLSEDRIAPYWQRICRLYGCGKSENGYCDEGLRKEADE